MPAQTAPATINATTIRSYLFYLTRHDPATGQRTVLLHFGSFKSATAASAALFREVAPGVKEYWPGMAEVRVFKGNTILNNARVFVIGEGVRG